jgi:hypothetical protein
MNNLNKIILPSNGLIEGIPREVAVRGMKGVEISTVYSSLSEASIDNVIKNVTDPSLDPDTLCDEDKKAILHETRRLTFGDELNLTLKCPICGKIHNYTINYKDLEVTVADQDKLEETFTMFDGKVIKRGIPTKATWNVITRHKEKRNLPDTYAFLLLQVAHIDTVNGKKMSVAELIEYLENIPGKDLVKLTKFLDYKFGLDTTFKTECKSCHTEFTGGVGINADLFR